MPLVVGVIVWVVSITAVVAVIGYVVDRSMVGEERQGIDRGSNT